MIYATLSNAISFAFCHALLQPSRELFHTSGLGLEFWGVKFYPTNPNPTSARKISTHGKRNKDFRWPLGRQAKQPRTVYDIIAEMNNYV